MTTLGVSKKTDLMIIILMVVIVVSMLAYAKITATRVERREEKNFEDLMRFFEDQRDKAGQRSYTLVLTFLYIYSIIYAERGFIMRDLSRVIIIITLLVAGWLIISLAGVVEIIANKLMGIGIDAIDRHNERIEREVMIDQHTMMLVFYFNPSSL